MAVMIRLKKMGAKGKPHFKIIVCDKRRSRNTRAIEELGFYDPSKKHWRKSAPLPQSASKS